MPKLAFARNLAQAALLVKQLDLKTSSWEDQDWRAPVRKEIARIIEEVNDSSWPNVRVQRCWAHKMRNLTDKVRKKDRQALKRSLQKIYRAKNQVKARAAAAQCAQRWQGKYPRVVASLREDLEELLNFFIFSEEKWRCATRTTNAIERRFVEVRRRTRPMGVFSDRTSMERSYLRFLPKKT